MRLNLLPASSGGDFLFPRYKKNIGSDNIRVISSETLDEYFQQFTRHARNRYPLDKTERTVVLCRLGIPIIMDAKQSFTGTLSNRQWLNEIHAGMEQTGSDYTHQWCLETLNNGLIADMALVRIFVKAKTRHNKNQWKLETGKNDEQQFAVGTVSPFSFGCSCCRQIDHIERTEREIFSSLSYDRQRTLLPLPIDCTLSFCKKHMEVPSNRVVVPQM